MHFKHSDTVYQLVCDQLNMTERQILFLFKFDTWELSLLYENLQFLSQFLFFIVLSLENSDNTFRITTTLLVFKVFNTFGLRTEHKRLGNARNTPCGIALKVVRDTPTCTQRVLGDAPLTT